MQLGPSCMRVIAAPVLIPPFSSPVPVSRALPGGKSDKDRYGCREIRSDRESWAGDISALTASGAAPTSGP